MKSLKKIADRSHLSFEHLITLYEYILDTGYMTREKVVEEIERFTIGLNIDEYYFKTTPIDEMAGHLIAISASRLVAEFGGEDVGIELISGREDRAIYFVEISRILEIEERIEEKYSGYRLESYRTGEDLSLRLYILTKPVFENIGKADQPEALSDFTAKAFLETSTPETIKRYEQAWEWMGHRMAPYISVTEKAETEETRIMVGIQGRTGTFLSGLTRLIKKYGIHSNRKYMEFFHDEKRVFSFYFNRFMEKYSLALTQQKKNKDIPEGGCKGIILLDADRQGEGRRAFKEYIDGLLDIIVEHKEVLAAEENKTEILFLGPDERTADLMDWASSYAKMRNYPFWKAFTTGKAPANGGIPHDTYGMTTASVHEYVLGILEKLEMAEESVSKVQTGGPDGDLGSNEILVSKDKSIGIADGSGVLFDPKGIDREELQRLAGKRAMVEAFDRSLLSPEGFYVSVEDKQVTLPNGTQVPNGEEFRNGFHLHPLASADLFVPCGGRPAAVNINNWKMLLDDKGCAKFKIIVEGANLFITEQARLRLEENGVIIIKDASANKGGVTSSSLEVLAALALSDDEFDQHMRVKDHTLPDFMKSYIESVLETIKNNARSEFNLLWSEHQKSKIPFTHLTNRLSKKINDITDAVFNSELPCQRRLREKIITEYVPKPLLDLLGAETILKRVPAPYLDAIVASKVATNYIYRHGMESNEIDFFNYLRTYL